MTADLGPEGQAPGSGGRLVVAEWQRRTEAEYRSAALATQVTLWLIQVGAPPDLIRDGLQVVEDELSHSELSAQVAGAAGGTEAPPVLDGRALTLPCPDGPLPAVALALVRYFCIGETVAVPMFRMYSTCTGDTLRSEAKLRSSGRPVRPSAAATSGTGV